MTDKFHNKYRIPSARLQNWDYRWAGAYFITICTQNREHYFGEIENGEMQLSPLGAIADVNRACCIYDAQKQRIIAYYEGNAEKKQLLQSLKQTLPFFMIPGSFIRLETLPVTKNGKIDRALLNEMNPASAKEKL